MIAGRRMDSLSKAYSKILADVMFGAMEEFPDARVSIRKRTSGCALQYRLEVFVRDTVYVHVVELSDLVAPSVAGCDAAWVITGQLVEGMKKHLREEGSKDE